MATSNPPNQLPADVRQEVEQAFGFVPAFTHVLPPEATRLWWATLRDFQLSQMTALDGKTKELIGLGVASQIPCQFCVTFHTEAARLNGATEREIQEAVFAAAVSRMGSTILNGTQPDPAVFQREVEQMVRHVKAQMAGKPVAVPAGRR